MTSIDVVIRNTANENFELVDAHTFERVAGPYRSFEVAMAVARSYTTGNLFHQTLDNRGRVMGEPVPVHAIRTAKT